MAGYDENNKKTKQPQDKVQLYLTNRLYNNEEDVPLCFIIIYIPESSRKRVQIKILIKADFVTLR